MEITDKELLAICNLSNLKMEFADVVKEKQRVPDPNNSGKFIEKILSNHTIYSLITNELEGIERRKIKKKSYDIELVKRLEKVTNTDISKDITGDTIKNIKNELNKKYLEEIGKDEAGNLGSFYSKNKDNRNIFVYFSKKGLQEEAPIIMEYYDRLQYGNKEGEFLKDWEIIYGGDFYEILLDYFILMKSDIEKKNKEDKDLEISIISSPIEKYNFKINQNFVFREDITEKKETKQKINFAFDLLTSILPTEELKAFISTKSIRVGDGLGNFSVPLTKALTGKTIYENVTSENLMNQFYELSNPKNKKDNILGELDVNISLDIIDIKVTIAKKKNTNDFIVAFNSSSDNNFINDLKKGALNLDLLTFNALISTIVKKHTNNSEANVYFTGFGDGAILSTACFLMIDSLDSNGNKKIDNINYRNKAFIGNEFYDFLSMISFDLYDIEKVSPGSFSYSVNFREDFKNFINAIYENAAATNNIGIIVSICLKRSLFLGISTVFLEIGWPVYLTLITIYFFYSDYNRRRLKKLENKFIEKKILSKKKKYNQINKEYFDYPSIIKSYPKFPLINERKFLIIDKKQVSDIITFGNKEIDSEAQIYNYIEEVFIKYKIEKLDLVPYEFKKGMTIYVPFIIAIKLVFSDIQLYENIVLPYYGETRFYKKTHNNTIVFGKNYNDLYFLKLDEKNNFAGIIKMKLSSIYHSQVYMISIKSPTFSYEKIVVQALNATFNAQKKYDDQKDTIINSEFVYLKESLNNEEKIFMKKVKDGVYQNTSYMNTLIENSEKNKSLDSNIVVEKKLERDFIDNKETATKEGDIKNSKENYNDEVNRGEFTRKDLRITAIDWHTKQSILLFKKTPANTKIISEVEGVQFYQKLNYPISEYIYFPYLQGNEMISKNINENFIGTLMRSIFRYEIKYNSLEEKQKDAEFESYEFYGTINKKNKELNDYFFQQIKLYGHKYCSWIHYNSVVNYLEGISYNQRLKVIENFYNIEVEDERLKKGILKVGILEDGIYSKKKLGYIYNQDKLYGRAIDIPYYYGYKEDVKDITTYGVCDGAILECNCGSNPNVLRVTSQNLEYSDNLLDATKEDKTVASFGSCSITDSDCSPDLDEWQGVSNGVAVNGLKCLLSTSTIKCKRGGSISILKPNCKIKVK